MRECSLQNIIQSKYKLTLSLCLIYFAGSVLGFYFNKLDFGKFLFWPSSAIALTFIVFSIVGTYLIVGAKDSERIAFENEKELIRNLEKKKTAEDALYLLDMSIRNSPVGFALIDKNYCYIRLNEAIALLNGKTVEDHLGKSLREMVPTIAIFVEEIIEHVFRTGTSLMSVPMKVKKRDGLFEEVYGLVSYYPVKYPGHKEIFGVAVTFEDLTQQHLVEERLRENQARLNFAQMAGKMGVFEWKFSFNIVHWSPQLEDIYGHEKGTFDGKISTWIDHIHPEDKEYVVKTMNFISKQEKDLNIQFRILKKDGEIRWIMARGAQIKDSMNKSIGLSGINIDITDQKNIEERLRNAEAELLGTLASRDEFFAIASHELKTPLTSLLLQVQLFQKTLLKSDSLISLKEKTAQILDKNYRQVIRLNRLVDDMLDVSRIRSGKLAFNKVPCEISYIVSDILGRLKEQFISSGSGEPRVLALDKGSGVWDPLRIEQVISNVISNAIRYGLGRPISVSVINLCNKVRVSVTDQGIGISKEEQDRIFNRFERCSNRDISGLGLGLYISKQILEAHNAQMLIESDLGKGSTFHIELPT